MGDTLEVTEPTEDYEQIRVSNLEALRAQKMQ